MTGGSAAPTIPAATMFQGLWRLKDVPDWLGRLETASETPPADSALPALPLLVDPCRARALLEDGIRAGSPAYANIRIAGCTPSVACYKPGSRCTVVYRLEYGPAAEGKDWPDVVVVKTHWGNKGRTAYQGMRALWESELRWSTAVTIAEPLGFLPEPRVLIQRAVPGKLRLSDLLESVLLGDTGTDMEILRDLLAKTARGLAALHGCGARGQVFGWKQEMAAVRKTVLRLAEWIPGLEGALEPSLAHLESLEALHPPQRPVPSHRSFRPAQVLLHEGQIAFIDFDGFCEAEPAMDLALFRVSISRAPMRLGPREGRPEPSSDHLSELDGLSDLFLDEYERMAPVSRERVALWETLYLLESVLKTRKTLQPERLEGGMALLQHHLRRSPLPPPVIAS